MGSWARRTSLGILMWNKRRLVSRRPSWKVGGSICTFWFSLESQVLKTRLRITYCFAFFFFFSCEERLLTALLAVTTTVLHLRKCWGEGERLPGVCMLASSRSKVKSQSSSKVLIQSAFFFFFYCWSGQGYILHEVIGGIEEDSVCFHWGDSASHSHIEESS